MLLNIYRIYKNNYINNKYGIFCYTTTRLSVFVIVKSQGIDAFRIYCVIYKLIFGLDILN